jgi:hypothetical protein
MKLLFWIGFIAMTIILLFILSKKPRYCNDCESIIPYGEAIEGPDGEDYCKRCFKVNFCKMEE